MSPERGTGPHRPGLHLVTTVSHGVETYLAGQPRRLQERFDVTLVCSPSAGLQQAASREGVGVAGVPMTRRITPLQDALSLYRLYRLFRRRRPAIVQTYSPKAGLVGMAAARLARVPVRVHGIIGLPLTEAAGLRARVLRLTERLTYANATRLTCNSTGLRRWVHAHLSRRPIDVIGRGSVNGVDTALLRPATAAERQAARADLGLVDAGCVFVFLGRLVRDKGVAELVEAFAAVHAEDPSSRLLLVGDYDDDSLPAATRAALADHPGIRHVGWRSDVRAMYAAADVLVLPSYREGMPNVVLEAAAMALPVVATDINGSNEIVVHGASGLLVPVKDADRLAAALRQLLAAPDRTAMGARGRSVVEADFDHVTFCGRLADYYDQLLAAR